MSRENAVRFLAAVAHGGDLRDELARTSPTLEAWVDAASRFGMQVSPTTLHELVRDILEEPSLEPEGSVPALLAAVASPLQPVGDEQLEAVAGGVQATGLQATIGSSSLLQDRLTTLGYPDLVSGLPVMTGLTVDEDALLDGEAEADPHAAQSS